MKQLKTATNLDYKDTAGCEYKKRTKEEIKIAKIFFDTNYVINDAIYEYGGFNQWLAHENI